MDAAASSLLTDLYQLNMLQAYQENGRTATAVEFLLNLRFGPDELDWLRCS